MSREWSYSVELRREAGEIHAYCEEMPEAVASGRTEAEACHEMSEAVIAAVRGRIKDGMDLPAPVAERQGQIFIALPASLAAKAALYVAWRRSGLTEKALADRIGASERDVRSILDPDHGSRLDRLAEAAAALGGRLAVSFESI